MSRILLIGKAGQLGSNFLEILSETPELEIISPILEELDLSEPETISNYLANLGPAPDIIINAAAYTAVDKAEDELEICEQINHHAVAKLAEYAKQNDSLLIHYSTDYVYNGEGHQEFIEDDPAKLGPQNHYGASKLRGDQAIDASGCKHLTFRTSWVYNHAGSNFVLTMLKLFQEREELTIVNDQIGSPTYAYDLAVTSNEIIKKYLTSEEIQFGTYHMVAPEKLSWYEFAQKIQKIAQQNYYNLKLKNLSPVTSDVFPTKAKRPHNSRLSVQKLYENFGLKLPLIEKSLQDCFDRMKQN
jgi:dTDP-4-dehydrorhamnose reductase